MFPIHINTDKNTKFESFVEVLDMLKKNQYSNVSIVTKKWVQKAKYRYANSFFL